DRRCAHPCLIPEDGDRVTRRRLAPAVLLAAFAAFVPGTRPLAQQAAEPLAPLWEKPVADAVGLAFAPDGAGAATVDSGGKIQCFDESGDLRWAASVPGAARIAMAAGGRRLAAYTPCSPLQSRVTLFGTRGAPLPPLEAGGPINATYLSADGSFLVAATPAG